MTHLEYIPIDAGATDGRSKSLRAADRTLHAGSWHEGRQVFVYSDGTRIAQTITHYLARLPGARRMPL